MFAKGEARPFTRPPNPQQIVILDQHLENQIWRSLGHAAENRITQQTSKNTQPRLEALYRRIALLMQIGFSVKSDEEAKVADQRAANYYVDVDRVEEDIYANELKTADGERETETSTANKSKSNSDPFDDALCDAGSAYLDVAGDLLAASLPRWFQTVPGYWPKKQTVAIFLEANARIPVCERGAFMYLVSYFSLFFACF